MVINPRSAGGMAAIWLVAVVGVSATAWVAIDRAGRDITNVSVKTMPPAPINTPTLTPQPAVTSPTPSATPKPSVTPRHRVAPTPVATPRHAASPTPTATPTPRATPTHAHPAPPTPQDRTISVTGGLVSVRCTGATIGLRIAQPEYGWRVHVDTSSEGKIVVSFQTGDEESQQKTQVTAVCTNGSPAFTVINQ